MFRCAQLIAKRPLGANIHMGVVVCALSAPLAAHAEEQATASPPAGFFAGRYAVIGAPGDGPAYRGGAVITALSDDTFRIERRIGGETTIETGRIELNRFNAPVIRIVAAPQDGVAEPALTSSCQFQVDVDNYGRLSCLRAPGGDGLVGYEALFPLDSSGGAQLRAFGFEE